MKISFPFSSRNTVTDLGASPATMSRFRTSSLRINRKLLIYLAIIVGLLITLFLGQKFLPKATQPLSASSSASQLKDAKTTQQINHELMIPIKNSKSEVVTEVKYTIQNAELRDEILVKGRKATAIDGRDFLVLNLKLVNSFNKPIEINTKDFVRLSVGDNPELFAPSIHNDPLTLQAISTQNSRVGFAVNEQDKNLKLHIGEINGDKTTIDLNF
jgi:hypothetical protein